MASAVVQLFCEDSGHERFMRALLERLARESGAAARISIGCARGGAGNALTHFKKYQDRLRRIRHHRRPDLLVVVIDGNCEGWNDRRTEILHAADPAVFPRFVIGVPDPHVERWCFADAIAFRRVVGMPPPADPGKCERELYKRLLANALDHAGIPVLTGPMEIAPDLVEDMDWTTIERTCPSLAHLVSDVQSQFRQFANG